MQLFPNRFQLPVLFVLSGVLLAQDVPTPPAAAPAAPQEIPATQTGSLATTLGPGDRITVAAPDIEELDRRELKVQLDGSVSVPLVGSMKVAGLTAQEFNEKLTEALRAQFRNPQVTFTKIEVRSKTATVLGAVNTPGVVLTDGRKRLIEVISAAGGLRNDAGPTLTLARKSKDASSFPSAFHTVLSGNYVSATISVDGLLEGVEPGANIIVRPGDVITVPKGRLVYVLGDVRRAGGFVMGQSNELTVLKALSLAQGLKETANSSHAKILRAGDTGQRVEQEIDLKKLLSGKGEDVTLKADDVLFVPGSTMKKISARALDGMIQVGTGVAIYRN